MEMSKTEIRKLEIPHTVRGSYLSSLTHSFIHQYGVGTMDELHMSAPEFTKESLMKIVAEMDDFEWVDRSQKWFWLGEENSAPLMAVFEKIFALTNELSIKEAYNTVSRIYPKDKSAPPPDIIRKLIDLSEEYCLINDHIVRISEEKPSLTIPEQLLVSIFKAHGPVLKVDDINNLWIRLDHPQATPARLNKLMLTSPVLIRIARGLYTIPGMNFSIADIKAASAQSGKAKQQTFNLNEDIITIEVQVTPRMYRHGLLTLVKKLNGLLFGIFEVLDANGNPVLKPTGEKCVINATSSNSLTQMMHPLRALEIPIDQKISLKFNDAEKTVTLEHLSKNGLEYGDLHYV